MKKVIIVRHAKSSWTDFSLSDFDRPLDTRGIHDAQVMAERLKEAGFLPDKIISSNAVRAKTTAGYFSNVFDISMEETNDLYHGLPDDYLDIIKAQDQKVGTIALFGHNPGITIIANLIKIGCTDNIPTCGIVIAELGDDNWSEAEWQKMKLLHLLYLKDHEG